MKSCHDKGKCGLGLALGSASPHIQKRHRKGTEMDRKVVVQNGSVGMLWFAGWLFSIGFLKLGFWQGLLGLIVWPYFLGSHFGGF